MEDSPDYAKPFEVSILVVGDTVRREFRQARAALEEWGRVLDAAEADSAAGILANGHFGADLIVVAQAYPGQFAPEAIERLRRLRPLARMLSLLGSWCEGETRTGSPVPATVRIYWHQWLPQCGRELGSLRQGLCSTWGLPHTATDEERLLAFAHRPPPSQHGLVAIHTQQLEMHDWLAEACRRRGYSTVWLQSAAAVRVEGAQAAIFDAADCDSSEADQLRCLAATLGQTPILALLDFPRIEDHDRALAAGAAAVVSKPLLIDDLFWELDRVTQSDRRPAGTQDSQSSDRSGQGG